MLQRVAVVLAWALVGGAAGGAAAQDGPVAGGHYPVGTVLPGVCKFGSRGVEIATTYQRWFQGAWSNAAYLPEQGTHECVQKLRSPGQWRMRVIQANGDKTIRIVGPFTVGTPGENPCDTDETKVVNVSAPNGGTSGLEGLVGTHLMESQRLTADANTYLDFADGSRMAIAKGSSVRLDGCSQPSAPKLPLTMRFSLALGQIWAKIAPHTKYVEVRTDRVVCGNRGTTFWIAYDTAAKATTVHVDEGSVAMTTGGRTTIVKAGQTGTQSGTGQPAVRAAPIAKGPPY